jgi:hypothetical protein
MPGPKPPPSCGQEFFSIFSLEWVSGSPDLNVGIDESYGVGVMISMRAGYAPFDDHGEELYIKATESLEAYSRIVMGLLDKSIPVMQAANNLIGSQAYTIIEPLRWQSTDASPSYVDGNWFGAAGGDEYSGLTQQINFGGARRKQPNVSYDRA